MSSHAMLCVGVLLGATGVGVAVLYLLDRHRWDVGRLEAWERKQKLYVPLAWEEERRARRDA